jgi:hypothetical protein
LEQTSEAESPSQEFDKSFILHTLYINLCFLLYSFEHAKIIKIIDIASKIKKKHVSLQQNSRITARYE